MPARRDHLQRPLVVSKPGCSHSFIRHFTPQEVQARLTGPKRDVLVLNKVVDCGEASHTALATLFDSAPLELVGHGCLAIDPYRTGLKRHRNP